MLASHIERPDDMSAERWMMVLSPDGAARTVALNVSQAFSDRLGTSSKAFDCRTYRNAFTDLLKKADDNLIVDLLNQSLVVSCLDFGATHLLVLALSPVTLFTLNLLRKYGVTTLHWFFEDFRRATYWQECIAGYDHFFAIQRGPLVQACENSNTYYHFLPTAGNYPERPVEPRERTIDVAFIGIPSPYRIAILEKLVTSGRTCAIAGSGWNEYSGMLKKMVINGQWTGENESLDLLRRAKIGINLSLNEPIEKQYVHISPRVYEILAAGSILVAENVPLLKESVRGCTYRTFDSSDDVCRVVEKALAEYPALAADGVKNRQALHDNHSYHHRVDEILRIAHS